MPVVQIEHPVPDFDAWKQAFDSDPVGREQSGVRRYQIFRPVDDPNYAIVELEFDDSGDAERFLAAMREVWGRVEGTIIGGPQARIVETVESKEY
jgi:hypothetical protein